jgi:uncharacterized repeat protein (TIGR03803 family)
MKQENRAGEVRMTIKAKSAALWMVFLAATASAQPQSFTVITTFEPGLAIVSHGAPILDSAGNVYSASGAGGAPCTIYQGCGFIFRVDPTGKITILYNFKGQPDGAEPLTPLALDNAGNVYGLTEVGGTYNYGTVFKVDPAGTETVLYSFAGPPDGANPFGGLIRDAAGNLYGTTSQGGVSNCFGLGCGTVFEFTTKGKEKILYHFTGGTDGGVPWAAPLLVGGVLYGTTNVGGNLSCQPGGNAAQGCGTVFKLQKGVETVLHSFNDTPDGGFPVSSVVRDASGNLYGTTQEGGDPNCNGGFGCGVAYKLDPPGAETVLHTFEAQDDGWILDAGLVFDQGNNLFGMTELGGGIFRIDSSGNFSVVYPLNNTSGDGGTTMVRDNEGNLWGIFNSEVFEFTP